MPFIPAANVIEAELRMTFDDQRIENTLFFQSPVAVTAFILSQLGTDLIAWWIANYAGLVADAVQLREVVTTDQTTATAGQVTTPAVATFGDGGASPMPSNVAICVSFRTDNRGRSFRGRNYISPIDVGHMIGPNQFDTSYLTSVVTAYNAINSALTGSLTWGVLSRRHNKANRSSGVFTPITGVVCVDNIVDSMRRRLPGRGA